MFIILSVRNAESPSETKFLNESEGKCPGTCMSAATHLSRKPLDRCERLAQRDPARCTLPVVPGPLYPAVVPCPLYPARCTLPVVPGPLYPARCTLPVVPCPLYPACCLTSQPKCQARTLHRFLAKRDVISVPFAVALQSCDVPLF
jgi:hypothetical protein